MKPHANIYNLYAAVNHFCLQAGEPLRKNEETAGSRKGWKIREEVLEVPAMHKNYYTHVYESKDVSKIMSQMANSFQSTKNVSVGCKLELPIARTLFAL